MTLRWADFITPSTLHLAPLLELLLEPVRCANQLAALQLGLQEVLVNAVQGISDLIQQNGLVNVDFADVKTIMSGIGLAMMGTGVAEGENRAMEAARKAISSPLLEGASVNGARGVIINVASIAGLVGSGSSIPYCASKAAVINLTLALARTLGPSIRVNAVAPGFIDGEWLRNGLGDDFEAAKLAKASHAVLGKVSRPEDIADAILALISADLVTGQTLVVDGGHSIGPRVVHGIK